MANIPDNFDGEAFQTAYNVTEDDWYVDDGVLVSDHPALQNLTDADLALFVVDLARIARIVARRDSAKTDAKAIPNFATQDAAWFQNWFDTNLSDTIIDGIADFAGLKVVLKKIVVILIGLTKMVVAMRNKNWPSLPED